MLPEASQTALLALAKRALEGFVTGQAVEFPDLNSVPAELRQPGAVFVTLRLGHTLRGCVGNTDGTHPLAYEVMNTAIAAASEDPRFGPLTREEFDGIHLEISVLTPFRRVPSAEAIIAGQHGVLIQRERRRGLFLPQVWKETGWDKSRFLSELCQSKTGLPAQAWKDPQTELYVFDVESFGTSCL